MDPGGILIDIGSVNFHLTFFVDKSRLHYPASMLLYTCTTMLVLVEEVVVC